MGATTARLFNVRTSVSTLVSSPLASVQLFSTCSLHSGASPMFGRWLLAEVRTLKRDNSMTRTREPPYRGLAILAPGRSVQSSTGKQYHTKRIGMRRLSILPVRRLAKAELTKAFHQVIARILQVAL